MPDRNRFLPQARIQAADNLVLAEQADHALFELAIELHVVVEIEVLLASQRLAHGSTSVGEMGMAQEFEAGFVRSGERASGRLASAFSSSSLDTETIVLAEDVSKMRDQCRPNFLGLKPSGRADVRAKWRACRESRRARSDRNSADRSKHCRRSRAR